MYTGIVLFLSLIAPSVSYARGGELIIIFILAVQLIFGLALFGGPTALLLGFIRLPPIVSTLLFPVIIVMLTALRVFILLNIVKVEPSYIYFLSNSNSKVYGIQKYFIYIEPTIALLSIVLSLVFWNRFRKN